MTPRVYYDIDGRECSLDTLCAREPAWAANRIRAAEQALAEQAAGEAERVRGEVMREQERWERHTAKILAAGDAVADAWSSELGTSHGSYREPLAAWLDLRARATSPAPEPVAAERMPMPVRVALWDAVNAYVATCGGDASAHVYGNTPRMNAVAEVERVVDDAIAAARKGGAR